MSTTKWTYNKIKTKSIRHNRSKEENINIILENSFEILNKNNKNKNIFDIMAEKINNGRLLFESYPSIK